MAYDDDNTRMMLDRIVELAGENATVRSDLSKAQVEIYALKQQINLSDMGIKRLTEEVDQLLAQRAHAWAHPAPPSPPMGKDANGDDIPF